MTDEFSRLILILAGMNLSQKELYLLITRLKRSRFDEIADEVARAKNFISAREAPFFNLADEPTSGKAHRNNSVSERVERLMKDEAGLSGQAAYNILRSLFLESGLLKDEDIPSLSKKSLKVWINKIVSLGVPEKELLRIATIARNKYSHSKPTDWQLGGVDK